MLALKKGVICIEFLAIYPQNALWVSNSYIIVIYLQSATSLIVHVCLLRKEIFKIDNGFLNFLINVFEGWYCPVFEEKLGLVIEDYSSHCLECPEVYDSYNSSKCKIIIYIYIIFLEVQTRFNL